MTRFHQSRCVLYSHNFVCAFYYSFNFLTFPFLSFTTDYHLRSVSNFALSKLEPGTDPSLDILHNFETAESGKYAACVVSFFCSSPRYLARLRFDGTYLKLYLA